MFGFDSSFSLRRLRVAGAVLNAGFGREPNSGDVTCFAIRFPRSQASQLEGCQCFVNFKVELPGRRIFKLTGTITWNLEPGTWNLELVT